MANTFIVEFEKPSGHSRSVRKADLSLKDSKYQVELFKAKKRGVKSSKSNKEQYIFHADGESGKSPWEEAHELLDHFFQQGKQIDFVEPEQEHLLFNPRELPRARMAGSDNFLQNWPQPEHHGSPAWHLDEEHSQLRKARDLAKAYFENDAKRVKIGHFDTGYDANHPCLPEHLNTKEARSFVPGDNPKDATDTEKGTSIEQQWHGAATLAILAGGHVEAFGKKNKFGDTFGGAPLAEVVPIRIADSVALIKTSAFAKALEYATDIGCEVVTMSMAGVPSIKWARAVNRAYENGVTIVTAAGNSWVKGPKSLLPKCLLYPARWERVIAACGVSCNHHPYVFDANPCDRPKKQTGFSHSEFMQGNYGPSSLMQYSIAAYTPNIPWAAAQGKDKWWSLSGGGTSSATPQVAAAAALWIQRFRKELEETKMAGTWKQVEAVRHALFNSADSTAFAESEKYFGNGCLKAAEALKPKYFPKGSELKKAVEASVFIPFLKVLFGGRRSIMNYPGKEEMFATELMQLAHHHPQLQELLTFDLSMKDVEKRENLPPQELLMNLRFALNEVGASSHLKQFMGLRP